MSAAEHRWGGNSGNRWRPASPQSSSDPEHNQRFRDSDGFQLSLQVETQFSQADGQSHKAESESHECKIWEIFEMIFFEKLFSWNEL